MLRLAGTACAVVSLTASLLAAEPPSIDALFPAGVQRGESVSVDLIGKPGDSPLHVWTDRPELTVEPATDSATVTVTAAAEAPPGVYWIRLANEAGAASLRPFVVGTLPEVWEVEANDSADVAQTIDPAGTVVNGVLSESADVDTFLVPLLTGQTLVASLDADRTLASPMDGVLQVVSPQGFVLQQNDDDHGIDPQIVFTAPADGTYAVRLFAFPKQPNSSIGFSSAKTYVYRLTLTTGPFADRAAPLTNDPAGAYRLLGWNIAETQEVVPSRDGDRLTAPLPIPGTWEFDRLPFMPDPVQTETDPAADTLPLPVPGAMWGSLEQPGDVDVYTFAATSGAKLSLAVAARALGSPLDPVLRILNADNKVLDTADDSGGGVFDPATTFSPPADGEYRIEISDRFGFGGPRFFYVLTATPERPGFTIQLDQDAYLLHPGDPLEIKLKLARTGGMQDPVTLAIEGLPEGVTATLTAPEPDESGAWIVPNGTNEATLKLEAAEGTTSSAPLSISGAAGESPRQSATAPLIRLPFRTPHLWLTVAPKP